jgi:predicted amidohydrolase YtcJ
MTRSSTVVLLTLALLYPSIRASRAHADRIFLDAKIWTGDTTHPYADALAVRGDRIIAVGTSAEVKALAEADTAVVNLHGRLVVPGFQDSHLHFPGRSINEVDLHGVESLEEFQQRLRAFARAHPSLPWITGSGWGYSAFPNQTVNRRYIDAVVSDRPVYLRERDGHMGLANSKALEVAGVTKTTADPPNGHIMRDESGEPTGEMKEAAQGLVARHIPRRTADDLYDSFLDHMDEAAAAGLTAAQDASTGLDTLRLFERATAANRLKLRLRLAPAILPGEGTAPRQHRLDHPLADSDLAPYRTLRDTFKGPLLKLVAVKGVLDGTVDARTAAMFDPYVGGGTGIPFWEQDDLNRTVALYDKEGFQVLLHAIGDKAIDMALNAFQYAAKTNGTTGRRHRVEHVEVPLLSDLPRFRQLGVIASTQPMFASPDPTVLENFARLLGPERSARADSFRIFDDAGVVQAFGSDWGVFPFEPLPAIYCAVTRTTPEGRPAGGWYPAGRISVEVALAHFTRDGAYATFDEQERGTLTTGKLADFVVLSNDILTSPPSTILHTKVLLTVMGGTDTYRNPEFGSLTHVP